MDDALVVLRAYDCLLGTLKACVYAENTLFKIEFHDLYSQKTEDCKTVLRDSVEDCKVLIERRYGLVTYQGRETDGSK